MANLIGWMACCLAIGQADATAPPRPGGMMLDQRLLERPEVRADLGLDEDQVRWRLRPFFAHFRID